MRYNRISARDFSLLHTYSSGQTLNFVGDYKEGNSRQSVSFFTQKGTFSATFVPSRSDKTSGIIYYAYSGSYAKSQAEAELKSMLGLDADMRQVYAIIGKDKTVAKAIGQFYGMRLVKADPWQTAVCFIASQYNNIKRIRQIIGRLAQKFGERLENQYLFPSCDSIASSSAEQLKACGLGFRAEYLLEFANACKNDNVLERLKGSNYTDAKKELMKFKGIGDKVADCILLFGYGKQEAFPVDVWIKRIVEKEYFKGRRQSINAIHKFAEDKFGAYAGYAQQYLFQYARLNKMKKQD